MAARKISKVLGKLIEANVKTVNATGWVASIADSMHQNKSHLKDYGVHMVRRLLETGMSPEEVAWSQVFPTAAAMVPNQAQVVCHPVLICIDPWALTWDSSHKL